MPPGLYRDPKTGKLKPRRGPGGQKTNPKPKPLPPAFVPTAIPGFNVPALPGQKPTRRTSTEGPKQVRKPRRTYAIPEIAPPEAVAAINRHGGRPVIETAPGSGQFRPTTMARIVRERARAAAYHQQQTEKFWASIFGAEQAQAEAAAKMKPNFMDAIGGALAGIGGGIVHGIEGLPRALVNHLFEQAYQGAQPQGPRGWQANTELGQIDRQIPGGQSLAAAGAAARDVLSLGTPSGGVNLVDLGKPGLKGAGAAAMAGTMFIPFGEGGGALAGDIARGAAREGGTAFVARALAESPGRQKLADFLFSRYSPDVADSFLQIADAQAIHTHQTISRELAGEIAMLDAKVADGSATAADVNLRKELGALQRFGVPADYYYQNLHEAGSGIPEWAQSAMRKKYPELDWNFKFEGPARGGKNFTEQAVTSRLKSKLNPRNFERGLQGNPIVRRKGIHLVGPITNRAWLARVIKVMPSKSERSYWANWYRTFEPLFRQAFGSDADAVMRGFAASQASTSPSGGMTAVLKVMDRLRRGEKVTSKDIGMIAPAIEQAVKDMPLQGGMAAKLSDFTDALGQMNTRTWMGNVAEGGAPAPSDIWAGRDLGYVDPKFANYLESKFGLKAGKDFVVDSPGAPQGLRYERISEQYNSIAADLNKMEGGKGFDGHQWTPADVQALGWGTIQKAVGVNPEDLIYALDRNAYEVATEVTQGVTGIGANLTLDQAQHVTTLFEPDIRALVEDTPGVYLMPVEQPFKFTTGGWAGGQNGSIQFKVIGTQRDVGNFVTRLAKAFDQEYVQATRMTSSAASKPRSALILSSPAFADERAKQEFFAALAENSPKSKNTMTQTIEAELGGYAAHSPVDGNEAIVIRTHRPVVTGKQVAPFIDRYKAAIAAAEKKTGIRVTAGHENLSMIVGGQHGVADALTSEAGRAGGVAAGRLDDQLAARIRARLERVVSGVSAGAAEAAARSGGDLLPAAERRVGVLHGLHAKAIGTKSPMLEAGFPRESSGVYISENTPMPTRIFAHEFFGHYLDKQVLERLRPAVREEITQMIGNDPEVFARAMEEYFLLGGEGRIMNVPEHLKPAFKLLGEKMLIETAAYSGAAADRTWLPPALADLFDSLHWYGRATGDPFVPGKTSYIRALRNLDSKMSLDAVAEIGDAEQAARFLRLNDKVQQLPGEARSRVAHNLVEKVADRISIALGAHDGRVSDLATFLKMTPEARVPKAAGRELAHEARRAVGQMHPSIKALPKEGGVEDVAHFWWRQLPSDQWNAGGLQLVLDRQAANLKSMTDGSVLHDLQDALDSVTADLKAVEWGSPEWADLARQMGEIKATIADLPQRAEDLARSIAQLDVTIAAKPTLDPNAMDAMARLSAERARILTEAGILDSERAANREGLVSNWLGLTPTGEESFVGHRMGKVRGASAQTIPSAVGVGRPRIPEGLSRANKLVLAETGRLRQSTHVAAEDWMAAQTYQRALTARHDLGLMGKAFDGGRIPEDSFLVNPKGRVVPKSWKTDPLAHLTDDQEQALEAKAKDILSSYLADGSDPEALQKMIEAAKEQGINLSDLRVVKKTVATRYFDQFIPHRAVTKGGKAWDNAVNTMSATLIFGRMGYIPKNVVQNLIMAVPHQGAFFLANAPRAAQILADPELRALVHVEIGSGATAALERELTQGGKVLKATHGVAGFMTKIADDPIRASAFVHEMAAEKVIPKLTPYLRPEDKVAIHNLLLDPNQRPLLNKIMQRTNDAMADFTRLTPKQRHWARRFLIIPGWLMAGSRYPIHFAITHPGRSAALAYVLAGEPGFDKLGLPQNPSLGDAFVRYGYNEGIKMPGDRLLRTTSISPVNTPYDMLMSILHRGTDTPSDYANPIIPALMNTLAGENARGVKTGYGSAALSNLRGLAPNINLIESLINPQATGTYPGDASRLGRIERELGVVPIKVVPGGSQAKRATDEWQTKIKKAQAAGVPLPPGWEEAVATKGEWQSIESQLPKGASDEEKAKAKFELLVKHHPNAAQLRRQAYAAFADPNRVRSADRVTDRLLGWSSLTTMSRLTTEAKRQKATKP